MDVHALAFSLYARDVYLDAVKGYLASAQKDFAQHGGAGRAWKRAYVRFRPPGGPLGPSEVEEVLRGWGEELEAETREACAGASSVDLFFALQLLPPGALPHLPSDARKGDTIGAMAVRRAATYGAQLYGSQVPDDYSAP